MRTYSPTWTDGLMTSSHVIGTHVLSKRYQNTGTQILYTCQWNEGTQMTWHDTDDVAHDRRNGLHRRSRPDTPSCAESRSDTSERRSEHRTGDQDERGVVCDASKRRRAARSRWVPGRKDLVRMSASCRADSTKAVTRGGDIDAARDSSTDSTDIARAAHLRLLAGAAGAKCRRTAARRSLCMGVLAARRGQQQRCATFIANKAAPPEIDTGNGRKVRAGVQ